MSLIDFGGLANPGAVPTISEGAVLSLSVPVPPDKVQHAIADAIDEFRESRHQTVAALERQVALLQERRQAVITAGVTGQLRILETV
jgi:type I restriction enzyme S subunit